MSNVTPDFSLSEHHEVYIMHLAPIVGGGYPEGEIEALKTLLEKISESDNSPEVVQDRGTLLPYRLWLLWNEMRAYFLKKWTVFFDRVDVLLCPTTPTPANLHMQKQPFNERAIMASGASRAYADNLVSPGVTTLCGLPSTAVSLGRDSTGLPIGMHVLGPAYGDKTTSPVMNLLENAGYVFK